MAQIRKKGKKSTPAISTASLPDIIFILLFFFMVVTVIRSSSLLVKNQLPRATELTKLKKKSMIEYIYIGTPKPEYQDVYGTAPRIQLNDRFAKTDDIPAFVEAAKQSRFEEKRNAIIYALKVDKDAKMGIVSDVKQELRKSDALKISYTAIPREGAVTLGEE